MSKNHQIILFLCLPSNHYFLLFFTIYIFSFIIIILPTPITVIFIPVIFFLLLVLPYLKKYLQHLLLLILLLLMKFKKRSLMNFLHHCHLPHLHLIIFCEHGNTLETSINLIYSHTLIYQLNKQNENSFYMFRQHIQSKLLYFYYFSYFTIKLKFKV